MLPAQCPGEVARQLEEVIGLVTADSHRAARSDGPTPWEGWRRPRGTAVADDSMAFETAPWPAAHREAQANCGVVEPKSDALDVSGSVGILVAPLLNGMLIGPFVSRA